MSLEDMYYTRGMSSPAESLSEVARDLGERERLLDEWVAVRQQVAGLEAKASALLGERMQLLNADIKEQPRYRDAIFRSTVAEFAAAGHLSETATERALVNAQALDDEFPAIRAAFHAGTISAEHVRELLSAATVVREAVCNRRVDDDTLSLYETASLLVAARETPLRTRTQARQIAAVLGDETLSERHTRAHKERGVSVRTLDDGLALLTAILPEWLAIAIQDRLTQLAREVISNRKDREPHLDSAVLDDGDDAVYEEDLDPWDAIFSDDTFATDPFAGLIDPLEDPDGCPDVEHIPDDERTLDQIRADLLTDLLLAGAPSAAHGTGLENVTARIQVTIAASTLIGADNLPAELDGHGPIHPDIARDLAGHNGGWSRLFLDPTGMVVETDAYSPTEAMKRHLRARDQHCRFPGCRVPVHRCEVDHNHDHAKGGRTHLSNLAHFCRRHHPLKHPYVDPTARWMAHALPDGSIEWTSPIGRRYADPPPRRVMFV